ncbi:hypothetical protein G4B88_007579, partial [Cannabis sativa]
NSCPFVSPDRSKFVVADYPWGSYNVFVDVAFRGVGSVGAVVLLDRDDKFLSQASHFSESVHDSPFFSLPPALSVLASALSLSRWPQDGALHPVIHIFVKMLFSRLSRGAHLLPYLKSLQDKAPAFRYLNNNLVCSSSNFIRGNNGYQRHFGYDIWRSKLTSEFSTSSSDKYCQFAQFSTKYTGRPLSLFRIQRHYASIVSKEQRSKKMLYYLTALVFAMVGCSYAAVPLYRRFCQATGYGGTVQRRESVEEKISRHAKDGTVTTREIVVQFNADVADGMQWKFIPTQREVRVKPGESALAFYTAENRSSTPITGVSTYNVTPMKAAVYFNKIQCFCFEEQRLLPGEQIDMPVFFYIDPEFETDPRMDGINNLILSYTFFKVSEE